MNTSFPCPNCEKGIVDFRGETKIEWEIVRGDKIKYIKILPDYIKIPTCDNCKQYFTNEVIDAFIQHTMNTVKAEKRSI